MTATIVATLEPTDATADEVTADPRVPNAAGFVAADFAREVTFVDRYWRSEDDDADTSWPIHVLGSRIMHQLDVELDGDLLPGVKKAALAFGPERATIVTLWVDPNLCDVAAPARIGDVYTHGAIDGRLVLTPDKPEWDWNASRELVVCHFYAQRVVFE